MNIRSSRSESYYWYIFIHNRWKIIVNKNQRSTLFIFSFSKNNEHSAWKFVEVCFAHSVKYMLKSLPPLSPMLSSERGLSSCRTVHDDVSLVPRGMYLLRLGARAALWCKGLSASYVLCVSSQFVPGTPCCFNGQHISYVTRTFRSPFEIHVK